MKIEKRKGKINRLIGKLFSRRRKDYIPVYLSRFETIDKLIEGGMLAIDLNSRYVCIDTNLHIQNMNSEKMYVAFFNNIRAYMNFHLGLLHKSMIKSEEPINFGVMLRQTIRYDVEKEEFYDPPKVEFHTLLVGLNKNETVYYEAFKINQ